jgi:hypothetical protein
MGTFGHGWVHPAWLKVPSTEKQKKNSSGPYIYIVIYIYIKIY